MPTLNLDSYAQDLTALRQLVSEARAGGGRTQKTSSKASVDVTVIAGGATITVLMLEAGLYVKGFRNAKGTYLFAGEKGGTNLKFGCSYVGSGNIGIFNSDDGAKVKQAKKDVLAAVATLAAFNGGNDLNLKVPLATMAFLISEALRFTVIADKMAEVLGSYDVTFTFLEFKEYVQNWAAMSGGSGPAGVIKNSVAIFQK